MPKYVAQRALNLVNPHIKSPRILILGVAYKPGVSDVRETPVTDLRKHLIALGAMIAWHDPLVSVWQDTQPVGLDWECDVAILATNQPGMDLDRLIKTKVPILDCTNSISGQDGVTSL